MLICIIRSDTVFYQLVHSSVSIKCHPPSFPFFIFSIPFSIFFHFSNFITIICYQRKKENKNILLVREHSYGVANVMWAIFISLNLLGFKKLFLYSRLMLTWIKLNMIYIFLNNMIFLLMIIYNKNKRNIILPLLIVSFSFYAQSNALIQS